MRVLVSFLRCVTVTSLEAIAERRKGERKGERERGGGRVVKERDILSSSVFSVEC